VNRKEQVIKHLTMMGYTIDTYNDITVVKLITNNGFGFCYAITPEAFETDNIVEKVVGVLNDYIIRML
jgi:hypothetical protein